MTSVLLVTGLLEGGMGTHVADLAMGLNEAGHTVSVAAPRSVILSFGLDQVGATVDLKVGSRPAPGDMAAMALLRVHMHSVDVVHAHGLRAGALTVLARASLRRRFRRRHRHHDGPGLVVTSHNAAPASGVTSMIYRTLEAIVLRGADEVLVVSPDLHRPTAARDKAVAAKANSRRANVSLAVVAASQTVVSVSTEGVRSRLGVNDADRLVVSVGRLATQKAHQRFIEAVAQCANRGLTIDAVIVGEGPARDELQDLIDATGAPVRLLGRRSDVPDLLAAADLVVSTALWEGQPVWLQEALAVGAPIVATDAGGTSVVLGDGAELVAASGTDQAVAQRISSSMTALLSDDPARSALRARARSRAEQLPTRRDAVEAALAAYRRAAPYESKST